MLAQLNAKFTQSLAQACRNGFDLPGPDTVERASDLIVAIANGEPVGRAIEIGVGPDGSVEFIFGAGVRMVTVFIEQGEPGFSVVTRDSATGEVAEADFMTPSQVVNRFAARAA